MGEIWRECASRTTASRATRAIVRGTGQRVVAFRLANAGGWSQRRRMHIIIGLIAGITLGALAGSAAVQFVAPAASFTVPANKAPLRDVPAVRSWDV